MDDELGQYLGEGAAFFAPPDLGLVASAKTGTKSPQMTQAGQTTNTYVAPQVTSAKQVDTSINRQPRDESSAGVSRGQSTFTHVPPSGSTSSPPAEKKGEPVFVPDIVFAPPPGNTAPGPGSNNAPYYEEPGSAIQRSGGSGTTTVLGLGFLAIVALWWLSSGNEKKPEGAA